MNLQDLGSIGEVVAAIATVATLIYLAIQIRQNGESVRMSAEMEVSKQFAGWASLVVNNPDLGRIWDAAAEDPGSLTDQDISQFLWFIMELLLLYEAQYHMYVKGHISEEAWDAKANMIFGTIQNPIVRKWWDAGLGPFSALFRAYMEQHKDATNVKWKYVSVSEAARTDT